MSLACGKEVGRTTKGQESLQMPSRRSVSDYRRALAAAQKPPHGTAAYSRFINRPIGRWLAACALAARLTPSQVTTLSALSTTAGLVLIAVLPISVPSALAIASALALGYALDSSDGQVARLTGLGSPRGEWYDHMVDCGKVSSLHLCVAIQWFRFGDHTPAQLLIPLLYSVVASLTFFGMVLTDLLRRHLHIGPARDAGSLSVMRSLILLPSDYGFLCVIFALMGWPHVFFVIYSAMAFGAVVLLVVAMGRWQRLLPGPD